MAAKLVNIVKAFTLSIVREGKLVKLRIEAGVHRLEDDVASHWYTQAHSEPMPKGVKQSNAGTEEEAAVKAAAEARAAEEAAEAEKKANEEAAVKAAAKK